MNVPKIRFNDFDDNIIKISIKELGNVITGTTPSTADRSNYGDEYLWASPVDMGDFKYINNTKTKLSEKGFNKTRCVPKDSILITCIGSTIGKTGMASKEMSTNQQINTLIPNKIYNSDYLYYCINFNFPRFLNKISFQAVPIISKSEFEKLEVSITKNIYEQEKIGKLLSLLDKKIELQSKKIEDLKLFKMSTLNSFFNNNTNVRKELISKYCNLFTGKNKSNKINLNGNFFIMDMGSISSEGYILKNKLTSDNSDMLSIGDLVMPKDDIGGGFIIGKTGYIDEDNKYVLGDHVYLIKSKGINSLFLHYQINSRYINLQLKRKVTGSAQLGLKASNILNQQIYVYNEEEQAKIAKIFELLDSKIKLEIKKNNKLINLKKGLMQNMFV